MRLDKFVAHATHLPRSEVRKRLKSGAVTVNDTKEKQAARQLTFEDIVRLHGEILHLPEPRYFMLHKPQGLVCSNHDGEHPTVLDCLNEPNKEALQIAGRLDIDTTGLVLLTDDGQWNHQITSPAHHKTKTYRLRTAEALTPDLPARFAAGIQLKDESRPCRPAQLTLLDDYTARLIISEGKYHQVKRMLAACGNRVTELHREAIGELQLDTSLNAGQYRHLTSTEVKQLSSSNE
ncbi:pseudouridine synthase [Gilvimarinus chinensis]|uniref:pseudouridine synthase n=1 Tax=Gilvimarinus chinensis TaxID=396005 RepID=UPI00036AE4EB|nr:pseudouridine synthase [Gilvimarinus chinensis]